jgi:three-Cys-motif partner protein
MPLCVRVRQVRLEGAVCRTFETWRTMVTMEGGYLLLSFFYKISAQSETKARIVAKYFRAWANVVLPSARTRSGKIAYIDLFAGPGRYEDDSASTPILILEQAVAEEDIRKALVSTFNDMNENNSNALQTAIDRIPGIEKLIYKPTVDNGEVTGQVAKALEEVHLVPTFFFIDPWGFKGLSLRLINSVLKDWGCDCIFFFNYNRINMGLGNDGVENHINDLFGKDKADRLRANIENANPREREGMILDGITEALHDRGGEFVLPFCFKNEEGTRTSHYLIFVTKHFRGYEIMKDIMAKESTSRPQGVPSFVYNPYDINVPPLIELETPLDDLKSMLCGDFHGRRVSMRQIYEEHSNGKRYVEANYKEALRRLEADDRVKTDPPASKRKKLKGVVTFANHVVVEFP